MVQNRPCQALPLNGVILREIQPLMDRALKSLSGGHAQQTAEYGNWVRQAAALVLAKKKGWQVYGPPMISYAVEKAVASDFPETEDR